MAQDTRGEWVLAQKGGNSTEAAFCQEVGEAGGGGESQVGWPHTNILSFPQAAGIMFSSSGKNDCRYLDWKGQAEPVPGRIGNMHT